MPELRRCAAAAAALACCLIAASCGGDDEPPVDANPLFGEQPNFVFVLTDDQDLASFNRRTMPNTKRLADSGTTFTDYVDPTPLCCPARAALLTGQYGHNNGVLSNKPGYALLREPENILPIWLQRVGYQTAYIGKFLNGYEKTAVDHKTPAPGWDHWAGLIGSHGYTSYKFSVDGNRRGDDGEYLTDYINRKAVGLVREMSGDQPFFLQVSQLAPHVENVNSSSKGYCGGNTLPAEQDQHRFDDVGLPPNPALNERDAADKPPFVTAGGRLSPKALERLTEIYECRLESLPAVDRGIRDLTRALGAAGELKSTIFIFASDNGTFHGEHRLPGGKGLAYQEAAKLPLVMRVPKQFLGGKDAVQSVNQPVANIDIPASIVEWAGAPSCPADGECAVLDGRSLIPVLQGEASVWPQNRGVVTELDLNAEAIEGRRGISCKYQGVRQGRWVYIRHTEIPDPVLHACVKGDIEELYDLKRDPHELENLAWEGADPGRRVRETQRRLAQLSAELADCNGIEGRDPEPATGNYCQ